MPKPLHNVISRSVSDEKSVRFYCIKGFSHSFEMTESVVVQRSHAGDAAVAWYV
jgi:hypothetical protein